MKTKVKNQNQSQKKSRLNQKLASSSLVDDTLRNESTIKLIDLLKLMDIYLFLYCYLLCQLFFGPYHDLITNK